MKRIYISICLIVGFISCQNETAIIVDQSEDILMKNYDYTKNIPFDTDDLFPQIKLNYFAGDFPCMSDDFPCLATFSANDLSWEIEPYKMQKEIADFFGQIYIEALTSEISNGNNVWLTSFQDQLDYEFFSYGKINFQPNLDGFLVLIQATHGQQSLKQLVMYGVKNNCVCSVIVLSTYVDKNNYTKSFLEKDTDIFFMIRIVDFNEKNYFPNIVYSRYSIKHPIRKKIYSFRFLLDDDGFIRDATSEIHRKWIIDELPLIELQTE